jgi:hypothetical protein
LEVSVGHVNVAAVVHKTLGAVGGKAEQVKGGGPLVNLFDKDDLFVVGAQGPLATKLQIGRHGPIGVLPFRSLGRAGERERRSIEERLGHEITRGRALDGQGEGEGRAHIYLARDGHLAAV